MSQAAAQFQFAAEFTGFLVAVAGLALVLLRDGLVTGAAWARMAMVVGLFCLAAAAFGHGVTDLEQSPEGLVLGLRGAGAAFALAGVLGWRPDVRVRNILLLSFTLVGASAAVAATGQDTPAGLTLVLGSAGVGGAFVVLSRKSIASRVAASASVSLLLLVLVLSVGLSAVVSNNVEEQAQRRLDARVLSEVAAAKNVSPEVTIPAAQVSAAYLTEFRVTNDRGESVPIVAFPVPTEMNFRLAALAGTFKNIGLAYLKPDHSVIGNTPDLDSATLVAIAGSSVVADATCASPQTLVSSSQVIGRSVFTIAAKSICTSTEHQDVGTVVAVRRFTDTYLAERIGSDPKLSLAVADRSGIVNSSGPTLDQRAITKLVSDAFDRGAEAATVVTGGRFVVARPFIDTDGNAVFAVVMASPTAEVLSTRQGLFRALFLIALGGTLLALALASFVGERIGANLRRLTLAASAIQEGDLTARAALTSEDEVGILSDTFDAMAESIGEQSDALRRAAADETRLRNRLETVVGGMGEALVAVDFSGRVTDVNRAAEELTGVSAPAAKGRPVREVVTLLADDSADVAARLSEPGPSRWNAMATVVHRDGGLVPVAVSAGVLRGPEDEVAGNVYVLRDLRGEQEVERMKTEFLSRIGHELRTPLTGIIGYSEILTRKEVTPDRARVWHEEILSASKRLQRIVEKLEFFASAGAGRVLLRPEHLDMRQLVDDLAVRWADRIVPPHRLTKKVSRQLPTLYADRRWITLSLEELLDNAVKFSPNGGRIQLVAIPVDASELERAREHPLGPVLDPLPSSAPVRDAAQLPAIEISVIDRGKGMSPEEMAMAFGDFVQGDASDTRRFGGLGLGLGLVKRVAEGHGGAVTCQSEAGKGTKLSILLPSLPIER